MSVELEMLCAADSWVALGNSTPHPVQAGPNYLVDHDTGVILTFSVWANKWAIAYHSFVNTKDEPEKYSKELFYASDRFANTLHKPRR